MICIDHPLLHLISPSQLNMAWRSTFMSIISSLYFSSVFHFSLFSLQSLFTSVSSLLLLLILSILVFESLMETALEENRRMNSDRAEAMLVRAFNMYRHPLLLSLQVDAKNNAIAAAMGTEKESSAGKGERIKLLEMAMEMEMDM